MEDDDIPNLRSLDLRTGAVRQYTDALGGNVAPAALAGKGGERVAFISYFKGEYRLQTIETTEPIKEVEQEVKTASAEETIDFQPDVTHEVVPENKRKKRTFEKLFLEGRPPLNVGVTSSGDFFGGSQIALTDVLGDHTLVATALSVQEFRSYEATYFNLSRRFHYGLSASTTRASSTPRPTGCRRASPAREPSPPAATPAAACWASIRSTSSTASSSRPAS